ncbi:MAG TPA: hypothetical protein VHW44_29895 [Pseudonocardiaceae bacterium]|jgi:hypothetical protein|nr:hypothetical protein [Pseudonocardiaceae bacterium]
MTAGSGRGSTPTDIERTAHAYCARCNPDPRPGERVIALCGATHPFWGRRDRPVSTCPVCYARAAETVYECGHAAQSM